MTTSYLLLSSEQECRELSAALWRLAVPEHARAGNDPTQYLCSWIKHPSRDQWALLIDSSYSFRRHAETKADIDAANDPRGTRASITAAFGAAMADPVKGAADVLAYVSARETIRLADVLPNFDAARTQTQTQMTAEGWFQHA